MNKKYKLIFPYLLLLPVLLFIFGIFIFGIVNIFLQSFGYFPAVGLKLFSLRYYKEILKDPNFFCSLKFSLYISFISSLLSVILGVLLAYLFLSTYLNDKAKFYNIYKIPVIVPHTIAAFLVFTIFSQSGFLSRVFFRLGFINNMVEFYPMTFDTKGLGVILAYVWKGAPFITLITYDILKKVSDTYSKAALNLGANNFQVFWYILFPLVLPTILLGFIILFTFSFGAYEIPYLLGPSKPKALPVLAYIYYKSVNLKDRPYSMVINVFIILFSLVLAFLYILLNKIIKKHGIDR